MSLALATPDPAPAPPPLRARRRLDRFEITLLAGFAALSLWVLGLDLFQVLARGRVWTGTDGFFIVDQLQYLSWIRSASEHVLASNLFVLRPTPADYFQPAVAISGAVSALGVAPWLSLLLWKPVAVLGMFAAVRAYARGTLHGLWARRAVLVLGLFFGSFTVVYGDFGLIGDLFPTFLSWGYTFGLLAIAAMLGALVAYDRARRRGRRLAAAPALLGAFAASLHPWQGELLIAVVLATEALTWWRRESGWEQRSDLWRDCSRARRLLALPTLTVVLTGLPLAYYLTLGHADISWRLARQASRHNYSLWSILLALAPLILPAVLGYRRPPQGFLGLATRVWPLAAVGIYILSSSSLSATPLHSFEGLTVPLAVLAVDGIRAPGWRRLPRRKLLGAVAVLIVTVPPTVYELAVARQFMAPQPGNANFITPDERDALDYLARDPERGGVLTRFYLGALVPGRTGRRTYVGDCLWSQPGCAPRAETAQQLFDGRLPPNRAAAFVAGTRARFALADCQEPADLRRELGREVVRMVRFGCARLYELAPAGAAFSEPAAGGA